MSTMPAPPGAASPKYAGEAWASARAAIGTPGLLPALEALGVTPDSVLAPERRRTLLRQNVDALRETSAVDGRCVDELLDEGEACIARMRAVRTANDHTLLHDPALDSWAWLLDPHEAPDSAERAMESERGGMHAPVVVCGMTPPASLLRLHTIVRAMDPAPLFRRRLLVVHEDLRTLAAACTCFDITRTLHEDAVVCFVGPDAVALFNAWFEGREDDALPKRLVQLDDAPGDLATRLEHVLNERGAAQSDALASLRASNEAALAGETLERAHDRLRAAALEGRSLRVLICTSRHTTYTRHSAEGMRLACEALGHDARVLVERDESSELTRVSYARAVDEHRPEFVVIINFPRSVAGDAIPKKIPCAVWIQDTMAHLFEPGASASMDGWDVYAGATPIEMWREHGYRPEAAMPHPVTACSHRFHDAPVAGSQRERFECDLAFVSHHAETPEALFRRLRTKFPTGAHAMLDALYEDARTIVSRAAEAAPALAAEEAVRHRFSALAGRAPNAHESATLLHQLMHPIMGRLFRHETIALAAGVCERRGWSMRLYGNGWHDHPLLSHLAHDAVEHGENLRACYQAAKAHLHIDLNALTHQRVFECALSGGLPLMRVWAGALDPCEVHALDELVQHAHPIGVDERGSARYAIEDVPLGRRLYQERGRLGLPTPSSIGATHLSTADTYARHEYFRNTVLRPFDVIDVLNGVHDVAFTNEASLETLLERAIGDREWASSRSGSMRESVLGLCSTESFAARLISHTARVLGWREIGDGDAGRTPTMDELREMYDAWSREVARG